MLAVVGLGNPGAAYKNSRHNAGFMLLDGIASGSLIENISFHRSSCRRIRRLLKVVLGRIVPLFLFLTICTLRLCLI